MRLASHQPIFLPWPGFFHKALHAEVMVLLDAVQFPLGRGWMTRNRLKSEQGELWLNIPVHRKGRGLQRICEVQTVERNDDWRRVHLRGLRHQYAHAPYLAYHLPEIEAVYAAGHATLLGHNLALIRLLWTALGIPAPLVLQSELGVEGRGTELLVGLCRALGADRHVSLAPAQRHLDARAFARAGLGLELLRFRPPIYPQLWGPFRYNLSALDLLLDCGPKARDIILGR